MLIAAVLAGCGAAEQRPALEKIEYTNLNDSGSRELLQELLSDAGVSDGRIQGFFRRLDHFNMENDNPLSLYCSLRARK